jgi:hypothetical protein
MLKYYVFVAFLFFLLACLRSTMWLLRDLTRRTCRYGICGLVNTSAVVPMGTTPEPEDSGRATERSLCMVKWIYPLVG